MLHGRHPGGHDYRRSPDHGAKHRRSSGLKPFDEITTGPELDKIDEAELRRRVRTTNVFARMVRNKSCAWCMH